MKNILFITLTTLILSGCAASDAYQQDHKKDPNITPLGYLFKGNPLAQPGPATTAPAQPSPTGVENASRAIS